MCDELMEAYKRSTLSFESLTTQDPSLLTVLLHDSNIVKLPVDDSPDFHRSEASYGTTPDYRSSTPDSTSYQSVETLLSTHNMVYKRDSIEDDSGERPDPVDGGSGYPLPDPDNLQTSMDWQNHQVFEESQSEENLDYFRSLRLQGQLGRGPSSSYFATRSEEKPQHHVRQVKVKLTGRDFYTHYVRAPPVRNQSVSHVTPVIPTTPSGSNRHPKTRNNRITRKHHEYHSSSSKSRMCSNGNMARMDADGNRLPPAHLMKRTDRVSELFSEVKNHRDRVHVRGERLVARGRREDENDKERRRRAELKRKCTQVLEMCPMKFRGMTTTKVEGLSSIVDYSKYVKLMLDCQYGGLCDTDRDCHSPENNI